MKKILSLLLILIIILGTSITCFAATPASGTDLSSRITKVPGERNYYDKTTDVTFNPINGKIVNFESLYQRIPGEKYFVKKGSNKAMFDPSIYSQFAIKSSSSLKLSATNLQESTKGFTFYVGLDVDLGAVIGGGVSGSFAISYNANNKTWSLSAVGSGSANMSIGTDTDAGVILGFVNGNENALSGYTTGATGNTPIGDLSITGDGKNVTVQLKVGVGAGGGVSETLVASKAIKLVTVRSFF